MTAPYVELRAHTAFSFGDGAVAPDVLIARAKVLGYHAIGITDHADLGGIVRAKLQATTETSIKVIAGAELRVDGKPLALLARNAAGCRNLGALITHARVGVLPGWDRANPRRTRGLPHVAWDVVAEHSEGLHCLTGPASGALAMLLRARDGRGAERWVGTCRDVFGDRMAIEVQDHQTGGEERALAGALVALAERMGVPWVVTNDPRYIDDGGRLVHDILTALRAGMTLDEATARGILHPNDTWRLHAPDEMARRWAGCEEGLHESVRIASECDFELRWLRPPLPDFPEVFGGDQMARLREEVYKGARVRWGDTLSEPQSRQLKHELSIIDELGFAGFFLVMWEAVDFARNTLNVLCQGRGSAANSAVAYCLGITAVDPVAHNLLFERFLSGVRVPGVSGEYAEAPDIDVDIEHKRREEVLDHMYKKYKREKSGMVCIIQTYRGPNAALDAMRALGYPVDVARMVSKRMHRYDPADGADALEDGLAEELGLCLDDARGKTLLAAMRAFDELPRMRSTHVGGFALSSVPIGEYLPVEHTTMGRTIIQFDKDDLDAIGVPKFDFLGLGALSLVRFSFDEIKRQTGKCLELYNLPQDDAETFAMIARGDTLGTFQIESRAQISSIVHTKPSEMYDIVVQVALVRPGPIQGKFVHPYTRRRRGKEAPVYVHPSLEDILKRTYGIPIFQEQAMNIAKRLGGLPIEKVDALRRAMGNIRKEEKLAAVIEELKQAMLDNADNTPRVTPDVAEQIGQDLQTFANYGFPESHAWSFALIAYATAYLKYHYAEYFYLGLLNAYPMGFYRPSTLIHDARRHGVEVRPPCLLSGTSQCTTEPTDDPSRRALRIGWKFIRGVGAKTIARLEGAQELRPFSSIADVIERVHLDRAEALQFARAAAFGAWEPDRRRAAWEALRAVGDVMPLARARETAYAPRPLDTRELIFQDYAATGICVTGHPMEHLRERLRGAAIFDSQALETVPDGARVRVGGLVTVRQQPTTAKGTIFLLLEDEFGYINIVVTKKMVEHYREVVKHEPFVVVDGYVARDDGTTNVIGVMFQKLPVSHSLIHDVHNFH